MKQTVKRKRVRIPNCTAIKNIEPAIHMVMEDYEIKAVNVYFYFSDYRDVVAYFNHPNEYSVACWINKGLKKLNFLYGLNSIDLFVLGYLTQKEFLEAPIKVHRLPTRLYHILKNAEVFCLNDVIRMGLPELKRQRGFGVRCYFDLIDVLDRKGFGDLLK